MRQGHARRTVRRGEVVTCAREGLCAWARLRGRMACASAWSQCSHIARRPVPVRIRREASLGNVDSAVASRSRRAVRPFLPALHAMQHAIVKGRSHPVDAEGLGTLCTSTLHPVKARRSEEAGNGRSVGNGCAVGREPDGLGFPIQVVRLWAVAVIVPSDDRPSRYQCFDRHESNTTGDGDRA